MNRHSPRHAPLIGKSGTGAVVFVSIGKPSSWRHESGCWPRNSTLCERVLSAWRAR